MTPDSPYPDLTGKLLLADPSLRDGLFHKSVILLAEHSAQSGAFGIILNRPSGRRVRELIDQPEFQSLSKLPVMLGGPVGRDQLTFASFWEHQGKFGFQTRIDVMEATASVQSEASVVRAFAGYSGWSKGQLEEEIANKAWIVTDPTTDLLTLPPRPALWQQIMRGLSPYHRLLADIPDEILAN